MDIGFYIADLLRNQDEVSLPGLGTFTKVRVPASYDSETNSFIPPGYHITFNNASVSYNSLTEYVSVHKNLSQSSAEYFVNKFTSTLVDLLQTSGTAEIKPLGIIRQQDDIVSFEASDNIEISGRFYGLKPVMERKEAFPSHTVEILNEEIADKLNKYFDPASYSFYNIDEQNGMKKTNVLSKSDYYNYLIVPAEKEDWYNKTLKRIQ